MILANLKKKRRDEGVTQEYLGQKIGRTSRTIAAYESGGDVRLHYAAKIAKVLHCSLDDLTSKPEELVTTGEN
jgi:transcriptional regulator with XRE-family HTH domain